MIIVVVVVVVVIIIIIMIVVVIIMMLLRGCRDSVKKVLPGEVFIRGSYRLS